MRLIVCYGVCIEWNSFQQIFMIKNSFPGTKGNKHIFSRIYLPAVQSIGGKVVHTVSNQLL